MPLLKFQPSYFHLIVVSSTCFEHPSVHHREELYMQFYGISFMLPYKQSGRWQDMLDSTKHILWKFKHPCLSHETSTIIFKSYKISVNFLSKLAVFWKAKSWASSTVVIYWLIRFLPSVSRGFAKKNCYIKLNSFEKF